ncbi:hypothetical protein ACWF94_16390 [Streptomyces sp. NPDC055078]
MLSDDETDPAPRPDHPGNCPGHCGGRGYRFSSLADEKPETCTGHAYRFAVRRRNEDTGQIHTVLLTDDEAEATWFNSDPDFYIWAEDREYVPPQWPVSLLKDDGAPF